MHGETLKFLLGCYVHSRGKELPVFRKCILPLYGGIYIRHGVGSQKAWIVNITAMMTSYFAWN